MKLPGLKSGESLKQVETINIYYRYGMDEENRKVE